MAERRSGSPPVEVFESVRTGHVWGNQVEEYFKLHHRFSADIEAETEAALERLGPSAHSVRSKVTALLKSQEMKYPLSVLPLLVHAVEAGAPGPAVPLAAVHVLWWTSACYLDDLADSHGANGPADLSVQEGLLAAMVTGHILPVKVLDSRRIPEPVRPALAAEIRDCWVAAGEGQLGDMSGEIGALPRSSVVATYRGKSGAPFGMITAMAATLAGGNAERILLWREFGFIFGILWQIFNDQEDITSGRNEDLLNGTVTYLLACALDDAPPAAGEHIRDLHTAARTSPVARAALADLLLSPSVLARYEKDINAFRDEAYRILSELGGDEQYLPVLRQLVEQASGLLL
ncbi:hypothetical protein ABZS98_28070 [Streptomyces avermitilis]|uniref:hypothetical protein n=1 Tax=Streptomyces avermitilis TaxID=33903 RepID=UPI0033BC27D0